MNEPTVPGKLPHHIEQRSEGPNSPNVVTGDKSTVKINGK